jgi:hypothetical protein
MRLVGIVMEQVPLPPMGPKGFDKDVGAVILKTAPSIGTDLLGDESAAGKGVVRE